MGNRVSVRSPAPSHLRYLDGLRGIAILMVMMVHSSQLVMGLSTSARNFTFYGVRGVQLFFIVSGLTLAINYADRPFHLVNFAARRFFRIAPMFYFGAILYLMLALTTTIPLSTRGSGSIDILATFLFLHGWVPGAINKVVPGGWSIAAEAMFYVIFPGLLLIRRPAVLGGFVLACYVAAGMLNLVLRRLAGGSAEGMEFALYFWPVQLPAFAGGCWLATQCQKQREPSPFAIGSLIVCLGCLVIDSQFRGRSNLLVAIALLTLFVWAVGRTRPIVLEGWFLPLIGRISFSLYIFHFLVLSLLRPLAEPTEALFGASVAFCFIYLATISLTGIVAYASYHWIEIPIIASTRQIGLSAEVKESRVG